MKRILLAVVIVSVFVAPAFADLFNFSVFGGYTTVSMAKVNGQINSLYNQYSSWGTGTVKKVDFSGGLDVGADLGVALLPGLTAVLRGEHVAPSDATVTFSDTSEDSIKYDMNAFVEPLLIGVSYAYTIPLLNIGLGGGLYGGYGWAFTNIKVSGQINGTSMSESDTASGSGFVGEINLDAKYNFVPAMSLGLKLGYRLADIPQMTINTTNTDLNLTKGQAMKDDNGNVVPFDYSGFLVGLCFNIVF